MGRASTIANKTPYQERREELGYSRDKASEVIGGGITADLLVKIENGTRDLRPEEVLKIAAGYKSPELCNYYCTNECAIGKECVPEVKVKDLAHSVLEVLASINTMKYEQEKLIEISADGMIEGDELEDFVRIQKELERISLTVDTFQMWTQQMLASGKIDPDEYLKIRNRA